jgi:uncharacterized small protein (DUF1192 family)
MGLQMCKKFLREKQVSDALVNEASGIAERFVKMRSRGWGDKENAIGTVADECGVSFGTIWSLLYRKPKRIWADNGEKIKAAYLAACEAQLRALQHEIELTKATSRPDSDAVRAAEALVRAALDAAP